MKHLLFSVILSFPFILSGQNQQSEAIAFINSLTASQDQKILLSLDDSNRDSWHYFPTTRFKRPGIKLGDLNDAQKALFNQFLRTWLSEAGFEKVQGVMELEGILGQLENNVSYRDQKKYYVAFYGNPNGEAWSWRLEGHHLSMHFTYVDGKKSYVPRFLGANPAKVPSGPKKNWEVLGREADLGLRLISMLDDVQKKKTIYQNTTPGDIITGNDTKVDPLKPQGILMNDLAPDQRAILLELIFEYVSNSPEEHAIERMSQVRLESNNIRFAWSGAIKKGNPYYYRIQGKTFLIEFDNSQGNGNHVHSVWRDFEGDFGRNLLREHYLSSGHH